MNTVVTRGFKRGYIQSTDILEEVGIELSVLYDEIDSTHKNFGLIEPDDESILQYRLDMKELQRRQAILEARHTRIRRKIKALKKAKPL